MVTTIPTTATESTKTNSSNVEVLLPIVEDLNYKPNIKITSEVSNIIQYLCKRFRNTEWSGVVFSKVEGSIVNRNIKILVEKLLFLDIGGSVETGFDMEKIGPEVVDFIMENNLLDYKMGYIHSHHTMQCFFSATDLTDLKRNTNPNGFYYSIIVNNFGDIVAKLSVQSENNNMYTFRQDDGSHSVWYTNDKPTNVALVFNCDVNSLLIPIPESVIKRVDKVQKDKEARLKANQKILESKSFPNLDWGGNAGFPYTRTSVTVSDLFDVDNVIHDTENYEIEGNIDALEIIYRTFFGKNSALYLNMTISTELIDFLEDFSIYHSKTNNSEIIKTITNKLNKIVKEYPEYWGEIFMYMDEELEGVMTDKDNIGVIKRPGKLFINEFKKYYNKIVK